MVLAAGRGERMRPLTDHTPKPLLQVQGHPLLKWHVDALARGGFTELMVNTAWLGEQIEAYFGPECPSAPVTPAHIHFSHEGRDFGGALETAGGIVRALPQLDAVFWVVAGDVYVPNFVFSKAAVARFRASDKLAHLWLVPNPAHNPKGDFGLAPQALPDGTRLVLNQADEQYTYSTIGLYRRALFEAPWCDVPAGNPQGMKTPLAPLLRRAIDNQRISAEVYWGDWTDVGTPQRLAQLNLSPSSTTP